MNQIYKSRENEKEEESLDVGFEVPDTSSILARLEEDFLLELRKEHTEEMEKEEKQGKPQKQRRGGAICCCGAEQCRIGPFVEKA